MLGTMRSYSTTDWWLFTRCGNGGQKRAGKWVQRLSFEFVSADFDEIRETCRAHSVPLNFGETVQTLVEVSSRSAVLLLDDESEK